MVPADDERILSDRPVRKGAYRRFRTRLGAPAHSGPLGDHAWVENGERRTAGTRIKRRLRSYRGLVGVAVALLLVGFGISFSLEFMLLFAAVPVTWLLFTYFRLRTFGGTRVTYVEFPYAPAGTLRVRFGIDEDGGQFRALSVDLECIAERLVPLPIGRWTRCLRLHGDTRQIHESHRLPGPGSDIEFAFDLPPGLPGTDLSAPFPTYWQLRVRGSTTGGPYEETFLLPVYAADAA